MTDVMGNKWQLFIHFGSISLEYKLTVQASHNMKAQASGKSLRCKNCKHRGHRRCQKDSRVLLCVSRLTNEVSEVNEVSEGSRSIWTNSLISVTTVNNKLMPDVEQNVLCT